MRGVGEETGTRGWRGEKRKGKGDGGTGEIVE